MDSPQRSAVQLQTFGRQGTVVHNISLPYSSALKISLDHIPQRVSFVLYALRFSFASGKEVEHNFKSPFPYSASISARDTRGCLISITFIPLVQWLAMERSSELNTFKKKVASVDIVC